MILSTFSGSDLVLSFLPGSATLSGSSAIFSAQTTIVGFDTLLCISETGFETALDLGVGRSTDFSGVTVSSAAKTFSGIPRSPPYLCICVSMYMCICVFAFAC